jgi:transcriptional regulator with AAA-type ATPase domain
MKNILVTWHYTTHGIAYLKHLLSGFYEGNKLNFNKNIQLNSLSQNKLNKTFSDKVNRTGCLFDKVYYMTAKQEVFDDLSNRIKYRKNMLTDEVVISEGTLDVWQDLINKDDVTSLDYVPSLEEDLKFVEEKYPKKYKKFISQLWRDVHHYTIADQIKWFKEYSNAEDHYSKRFIELKTKISNLRDAKEIASEVKTKIDLLVGKHPNANFYIVISLGSNETQVVWHSLSQAGMLPKNTKFLMAYDHKKDKTNQRFKNFDILEVPTSLFDEIKPSFIFSNPKSEKRQIANLKMDHYINAGFSILILGERGTGKSRLAEKYENENRKFIPVNCASFDTDDKAEAVLFGYDASGSSNRGITKEGLFHKAKNGILFLDEIHHLKKPVQEKLMKALETDSNNNFTIRKQGGTSVDEIQCTIILASNKSIKELKEKYLNEPFFDRIAQNIIKLPSLRDSDKDRLDDWRKVWKHMNFKPERNTPEDPVFLKWLNVQKLYGNYRDLQKIAIYYNNYLMFVTELRELLNQEFGIKTALDYVKKEFGELQSPYLDSDHNYFTTTQPIDTIVNDFKKDFAIWLNKRFGSMQKASDFYENEFGETYDPRTLYNWRKGKEK